jgi:hypothetical protein
MSFLRVGPAGRARVQVSGSAAGNAVAVDLAQTLVALDVIDWIGSDPYAHAIAGTKGLVAWWRLNDANQAAGLLDAYGTQLGTPKNGAFTATGLTYAAAGEGPGVGSDKAIAFAGGGATVASLDLSGTNTITVEFWLNWTAYGADDKLALEFGTPNFQTSPFGFLIDPNSSYTTGRFELSIRGSVGQSTWSIARPSAGVWHHYAIVLTLGSPDTCTAYVDGAAATLTTTTLSSNAQNFASNTLSLMSRAATSLFGAGTMDELAIYKRALTAAEVAAHYAQR